jgi:hypothetical protein
MRNTGASRSFAFSVVFLRDATSLQQVGDWLARRAAKFGPLKQDERCHKQKARRPSGRISDYRSRPTEAEYRPTNQN